MQMFIHTCQYCPRKVERTFENIEKVTCFDCKKAMRTKRSADIQAVLSAKIKDRRAGESEARAVRNEKLYALANGEMTLTQIGESMTPKMSLSSVSRVLINYERKHKMKFPRNHGLGKIHKKVA